MTASTIARPGGVALKYRWAAPDRALKGGTPMTGREAMNYIRRTWAGHEARILDSGDLLVWDVVTRQQAVYAPSLPEPSDLHALVSPTVDSMGLPVNARTLMEKALEAAADDDGTACVKACRQFLAATAVAK